MNFFCLIIDKYVYTIQSKYYNIQVFNNQRTTIKVPELLRLL